MVAGWVVAGIVAATAAALQIGVLIVVHIKGCGWWAKNQKIRVWGSRCCVQNTGKKSEFIYKNCVFSRKSKPWPETECLLVGFSRTIVAVSAVVCGALTRDRVRFAVWQKRVQGLVKAREHRPFTAWHGWRTEKRQTEKIQTENEEELFICHHDKCFFSVSSLPVRWNLNLAFIFFRNLFEKILILTSSQ